MKKEQVPILDIIQEKETELKVKVLEAKKEAESTITAARAEATKTCQEARLQAENDIKLLVSEGISRAKAEGEKILNSTKSSISSLNTSSTAHFQQAVDLIIKAIIDESATESPKKEEGIVVPILANKVDQGPDQIIEAADGGCEDAS